MAQEEKINLYLSKIKNPPGKLSQEEQGILLAFDTWVKQKRPFSDKIIQSGILEKYKEDLQKAKQRAKIFFLNQFLLYLDPEEDLKPSQIPLILEVIDNQSLLLSEFKKVQTETLAQIPEPVKKTISSFLSHQDKTGFSFREWERMSADLSKEIDQRILRHAALLCIPLFYLNIAETNLIALLSRFNYLKELQNALGKMGSEEREKIVVEIKEILPILKKYKYGAVADLPPEIRSKISKSSCFPPLTTGGIEPVQYLLDIAILIEYFIPTKKPDS
jgi:hypothetical protein